MHWDIDQSNAIREPYTVRQDIVQEAIDVITIVKDRLAAASDRQKKYADGKLSVLLFILEVNGVVITLNKYKF